MKRIPDRVVNRILDSVKLASEAEALSNAQLVTELQEAFIEEPVTSRRYILMEQAWNRLDPCWMTRDDGELCPLCATGQGRTPQSTQESGEACMWAVLAGALVVCGVLAYVAANWFMGR